jgi:hypothetical protein
MTKFPAKRFTLLNVKSSCESRPRYVCLWTLPSRSKTVCSQEFSAVRDVG